MENHKGYNVTRIAPSASEIHSAARGLDCLLKARANDAEDLRDLAGIFSARLTGEECGLIAAAALLAADPDDSAHVASLFHVEPEPDEPGMPMAWADICRNARKRSPAKGDPALIPDFDDPHFEAKLRPETAPLNERKRLFVRLWNSFPESDRAAFLRNIASPGEKRRAMA